MKAQDLRIGNLVNYETAEGDVLPNVIDWQDLKWLSEDENGFNLVHNPIPLTEEWLWKFGFYKMEDTSPYNYRIFKNKSFFYIRYGHFLDGANNEEFNGFNGLFVGNKFIRIIKYVHDVQNLVFSLTGVELTLNNNL
jgi:hypothetical protein